MVDIVLCCALGIAVGSLVLWLAALSRIAYAEADPGRAASHRGFSG